MELKTVQWNIGGGKLLDADANPTLSSYTIDGLEAIVEFLKQQQPDIVTLQETHTSDGYSQAGLIAEALGYANWLNDEYAASHIETGKRLGQAIISRFPIENHDFDWFNNPGITVIQEDGTTVGPHDKGRSRCILRLDSRKTITVQTCHSVPLRRFAVDVESEQATSVFNDMSLHLLTDEVGLIQGDFNVDTQSLRKIFPALFNAGFDEVLQSEPTTPKQRRYDHVLFKDLCLLGSSTLSDVRTDHYPVVTTFELLK